MSELTAAVREAQADADRRFGAGPVQPWEPPPVLSESTRRRLAIVAVASLLVTALLVALAVARTAPVAEAASVEPLLPPVPMPVDADEVDEVDEEAIDRPEPAQAEASSLALDRHGAEWQLTAQGAPRLEAIRVLAEASGARLHGSPDAWASARALHLQWRGRSLAQAWPLVLGADVSYALQCGRDRCEVWVLGPVRADSQRMAAGAPSFAPDAGQPSLPMPIPMADEDTSPDRD